MKNKIIDKVHQILDDNKAQDIVIIDLKDKSSIADYMVIASGTSSRHIQAISEITAQKLKSYGIDNCRIEGQESNDWKLIDAIEVIIHIFHPEKRSSYNLEKMWEDVLPKTANYCLMKISILCEGRLNKGLENELCNIYIKRTLSLKKSGILNLEIKNKPNKTNNSKNTKNLILDEKGKNINTMDLVE